MNYKLKFIKQSYNSKYVYILIYFAIFIRLKFELEFNLTLCKTIMPVSRWRFCTRVRCIFVKIHIYQMIDHCLEIVYNHFCLGFFLNMSRMTIDTFTFKN